MTSTPNGDLAALHREVGQHATDIAVLHREMGELKDGQDQLKGMTSAQGEILHAIRADLRVNRFPGVGHIFQMALWSGGVVGMVVAAITYIASNFIAGTLSPKIVALEKQNLLLDYRLSQTEKNPRLAFRLKGLE